MSYSGAKKTKEYRKTKKGKKALKQVALNRRERYLELKRQYSCEICGESDPACIDFHHRDPKTKERDISNAATQWCLERLKKELGKCSALCANCHRKLHFYKEEY